jgi:hypothetical protein
VIFDGRICGRFCRWLGCQIVPLAKGFLDRRGGTGTYTLQRPKIRNIGCQSWAKILKKNIFFNHINRNSRITFIIPFLCFYLTSGEWFSDAVNVRRFAVKPSYVPTSFENPTGIRAAMMAPDRETTPSGDHPKEKCQDQV